MQPTELLDRLGAAPRMNGEHQVDVRAVISSRHAHFMAELAKDACTARRSSLIAAAGSLASRCDYADLHETRKPEAT